MQDTTPRGGIQAIARAGRVLRALEAAPEGLTLAALSTAVDLPKSTVHRLVAALTEEELVTTSPDGAIRLGGGLVRLGAATRRALRHDLRPVLAQLRDEVDETVDLSVLDGPSVRFVDQLPAEHRLRAVSAVGVAFPLHTTANGKALLAALPDDAVAALVPRDAALAAELDEIRRTGIAFDREEHTEGISAVGTAVHDAAGPVAAISIPVPTARFARNEARYVAALRVAGAAASARLGGAAG
ncbi:MAG: IclR family transcriptional regulator [Solirubrobacteraceae bacterium]|nr:IclR family transcriptional regulator [Solirubrobacteraceae bacterium]